MVSELPIEKVYCRQMILLSSKVIGNSFERWMNGINQHNQNTGLVDPVDYQADMIVEQLRRDGTVSKRYDFRGTFPTNISAIDVNYDSENAIEEFTVELQVQYWESNTTS